MKKHYNTYRIYIKQRFGKPVLKVPVNAGFSCPNRDGTLSSTGCSFCDNRSFSPVAACDTSPLDQLDTAIKKSRRRFDMFIVYLQPFSNTYGSLSLLRSVYEPLISRPGVVGMALGTRPDCFSKEIYDYLADMSRRTYLSVELGLQSASDEILRSVNRGHSFAQFSNACNELDKRKIETVAHVIIGLPGETAETVCLTAQKLAILPIQGIKIHQLMIIKGTELAALHDKGILSALNLEEYARYLSLFLQHLRPDQHIHRIIADAHPGKGLIAPLWCANKAAALAYINNYLAKHLIYQGHLYAAER